MTTWFTRAVTTLLLAAAPLVADAETLIRVTLQLPESHSLGSNWKAFAKIVEQRSGGELKVELYSSAQLFKDSEVPEAVGGGAIEAGSAFLGRFADQVPAVDVVAIPFMFDNETHIRASVARGSKMRTILDHAILQHSNNRVLWWQAYGRNIYLSKGAPVVTPSDIRGERVRTYGKVQSWTVETLGGTPLLLSGSQQFDAYRRGAVDIGMTGASAVKSRKLYEVMDHMTLTFDSAIEFVAVMNNDFYQRLSAEHRAIIRAAASEVEQQLRDEIYAQENAVVEEMKSRMTVVELDNAGRARWAVATSGVIDRFAAKTGAIGVSVVAAAKAARTQ